MTEGTIASRSRPPVSLPGGRSDRSVVGVAVLILLGGSVYVSRAVDWRQAALFLVGGAAGLVLYHATFGFTSAWRVFIADGRGAGLRAQMLMLGLTCLVFFPLIASGTTLLGRTATGFVAPLGVSVMVGAFVFGVGMQIGGG